MVVRLLQVRIYEQTVAVDQQGIAVRRGARHSFGSNDAAVLLRRDLHARCWCRALLGEQSRQVDDQGVERRVEMS